MTALLEFARHSSHKANSNFLYSGEVSDPDKTPLDVLGKYKLGGGAIVEEHDYAIK